MAYFYVLQVWHCALLASGRLQIGVRKELDVLVYLLVCPLVVHHNPLEAVFSVLHILDIIVHLVRVVRHFVVDVLEALVQAALQLVELRIVRLAFDHAGNIEPEVVVKTLIFVGHHGPVDVETVDLVVWHFVHGIWIAVERRRRMYLI